MAQAKFCSYCGQRLAIPCPSCETLNAPDALFCHNCGGSLVGERTPLERPAETAVHPRLAALGCPRCGTANEPASTYCYQCGLPLEDQQVELKPRHAGTQDRLGPPFRIPLVRVLIMSILSAGLYFFYWFYLTWKHYRDGTGKEAYPVWHALTLLIPIYGLFRIHAHMRIYKELMTVQGMTTTISPAWAVAATIISVVLPYLMFYSLMTTFLMQEWISVLLVVSPVATITLLLLHVQSNFNRYWSQINEHVTSTGFSFVEAGLALVGLYSWFVYAMAVWFSWTYESNLPSPFP